MRRLIAVFAGIVALLASVPASAGVFTITSPGPLNSLSISIKIANDDGFDLLKVTFDTSGTTSTEAGNPPLVWGGSTISGPPGGTATLFGGVQGSMVWGYEFTGFEDGESVNIGWDPDTALNASYGATVVDQVGLLITLDTGGGTVDGTFEIDSDNFGLIAIIDSPTSVPEPATLLLVGAGLLLAGVARRKKLA